MQIIKLSTILFIAIIFVSLFVMPVDAGWWDNLFKVSNEQKAVVKFEDTKIINNYERGLQWERTVQNKICTTVGGCLLTAESATQKLKWSNYNEEMFIIYGGKATNKFINNNQLYNKGLFSKATFTREPDFIEITHINGKITSIIIIDAKTTATAVRTAQDNDFIDFCRRSNIKCNVEYVVPKDIMKQTDASFICLAAPALALAGPVGWTIDGLCFFATS